MYNRRTQRQILAGISIIGAAMCAAPANAQWTAIGSSTGISAAGSSYVGLTKDSLGNIYVAYEDSSVSKGSVQKYSGSSWSYLGSAGITGGNVMYNSIAVNNAGKVYYAYHDVTSTKLFIQELNNSGTVSTWSNMSGGGVYTNTIKIGPGGYPYHFSRDLSVSSVLARRYNGSSWQQVGVTTGLNLSSVAYYPSMVLGKNDSMYITYVSPLSALYVYKIHTSAAATDSWQAVGTTAFGTTTSNSIFQHNASMAIDSSNRLYVVYVSTGAEGNKLKARKYENGAWTTLGTDNFSTGSATYLSLAVTPSGTPYVAFTDGANSSKTTIMKYDGTQWVIVGTAGISAGATKYNALTLDANDNPVVAYCDGGNSNKVVVMRYSPACAGADPSATVGSTSCVTFKYNGSNVTYTTVRAADNNIWLQQNLGSSGVATALADTTGYGDNFQWGRWDDGHQKRNSVTGPVPITNNPSGLGSGSSTYFTSTPYWWTGGVLGDTWDADSAVHVTSAKGCDPCKAIGSGWHMPSQAEWTTAMTSEGVTTQAQAIASNLKLPMAGNRTSSGGFDFVGARGYYWSSTTSSTGAKYLYAGTTIINPAAGGPRYQGMSIRCLKTIVNVVDSVDVGTLNNVPATISTNGDSLKMVAKVYPATINQNVTWSLKTVTGSATISATGVVYAIANGTVWAKAVSVQDTTKADSMLITITNQIVPVTRVAVYVKNGTPAVINTSLGTLQMAADVLPSNANQNVTWSIITGTGSATVSAIGLVTASANGIVWVKAVSVTDTTMSDSMSITITNQLVPVTKLSVYIPSGVPAEIKTKQGTLQMGAVLLPSNTNQNVTWSVIKGTGDASINSNGLLSANADGYVWAKAVSVQDTTMTDSMKIIITEQTPSPNSVSGIKTTGCKVYPNPVDEGFYLQIENETSAGEICIFDKLGRKLISRSFLANELRSKLYIDMTMLAADNYILLVKTEGKIYRHSISKTK